MPWTRTRLPTSTPPTSGKPATTRKQSLDQPARSPIRNMPLPARPRHTSMIEPSRVAWIRDKGRDMRTSANETSPPVSPPQPISPRRLRDLHHRGGEAVSLYRRRHLPSVRPADSLADNHLLGPLVVRAG